MGAFRIVTAVAFAVGFMALTGAPMAFAKTPAGIDWVRGFAAAPMYLPRNTEMTVDNQTVRMPVRLTVSGSKITVRLSHEHGRAPAMISAASVTVGGTIIPLRFSGDGSAMIPPGAVVISDPVDVHVKADDIIDVSLYLAAPTLLSTIHRDPMNVAQVSTPGNFTQSPTLPVATTTVMRPFLAAIDVMPDKLSKTIVTLGDSISDWDCPYTDQPCQWEGELQQRLAKAGKSYAIANVAISAGRIVRDGPDAPWSSLSAEARFERDVLSAPNVGYVVMMMGVNDIGMSGPNTDPAKDSPVVSADALIEGMKHLITRAHDRGLRIYAAEILPFGGAGSFSADKEAVRQRVNTWIRTSGAFDAVVNFQGAVADPADPTRLLKSMDNGDHLHPNAAGQRAMGDAIDLSLFP